MECIDGQKDKQTMAPTALMGHRVTNSRTLAPSVLESEIVKMRLRS
jgi:hypothetical protein